MERFDAGTTTAPIAAVTIAASSGAMRPSNATIPSGSTHHRNIRRW